jgi:hypothetical protein
MEGTGRSFGWARPLRCERHRLPAHDRIATAFGQPYARLYAKQLDRCGMRKPHRCERTVGAASDYSFQATQNEITYTSNVHTEWSVTFRAIGKR